jgi:hypothetical protein
MTGATAKSKPKSTKLDEKELARLQKQDYWLRISRAKLVMDLIFVCEFTRTEVGISEKITYTMDITSLRTLLYQTGSGHCERLDWTVVGYSQASDGD